MRLPKLNEDGKEAVPEFVIPAEAGIHVFNRYGCPLLRAWQNFLLKGIFKFWHYRQEDTLDLIFMKIYITEQM